MKVLVVDDEQPIVEAVTYNLRKEGFEPLTAYDAEQCLEMARAQSPDLIILDVMLPSASGFDVCRQLRKLGGKKGAVPIIMLTARAGEGDRVAGLELGADDYVVKPFSMRELMARVKTVLRRKNEPPLTEPVVVGDLTIDPERYEATVRGQRVELSRKEFDLLYFFATHPDQTFARETLLDRVWGEDSYVVDRTVDVHVRWLREKIEAAPSSPQKILTVRGVGYKFSR